MSHELQGKLSRASDSFALHSFFASARVSEASAQRSVFLCAERSELLLSYGFLGYGFLTEATAALVITLACLLLGRDQHSAAVDDRGSGDSSTPFDLPRRNEKVNPDAR